MYIKQTHYNVEWTWGVFALITTHEGSTIDRAHVTLPPLIFTILARGEPGQSAGLSFGRCRELWCLRKSKWSSSYCCTFVLTPTAGDW